MNSIEAECLGKKLCAFVIQIEMSSFPFPSGMHHSSLLSPHDKQFGVCACTFRLAQMFTLLKYVQRDGCRLENQANPSFPQGIPVRTQAEYEIKPLNSIKTL